MNRGALPPRSPYTLVMKKKQFNCMQSRDNHKIMADDNNSAIVCQLAFSN